VNAAVPGYFLSERSERRPVPLFFFGGVRQKGGNGYEIHFVSNAVKNGPRRGGNRLYNNRRCIKNQPRAKGVQVIK